jgi:anti-anti-sigma factor
MEFRNLEIITEHQLLSEGYSKILFKFKGNLSEYDAYLLRNNIENWLSKNCTEYVFDLSELSNIDISGINVLVQIKKNIEDKNAIYSFIIPYKRNVLEPIYITKLGEALNIEYYLDNDFGDEKL